MRDNDNNQISLVRGVRSKLLPPTQFERLLERLIEALPRSLIGVELIPGPDVQIIDGDRQIYHSTSSDPAFSLYLKDDAPKQGWYYLEAALTRHNGDRIAKLYIDCGNGYREIDAIFIPSNLRGSIREVFYLPRNVRSLRWDPMESPGVFNQSHLVLHRISALESIFRRGWRVFSDLFRYRKMPPESRGGLSIRGAITNLSDAYRQSASLRSIRYLPGDDYAEWIRRFDLLTDKNREQIVRRIAEMDRRPLISILMPCFNSNIDWLKTAIDSVRSQIYPYWELCIADDASDDPYVHKILEDYRSGDKRIKVNFRQSRGHICSATNSALQMANGKYIGLLDHDDVLAELALYHVADCIQKNNNVGLIYTDEDKIDEAGQRISPHFKTEFNYELFLGHNYISHFCVFKAELVRELGGFRSGYEGAQDWDLALRCVEHLHFRDIKHIPHVLYHWRIHKESTASLGYQAKPYAYVAAEKVLQEHFARKNIAATPEFLPEISAFRIRYERPVDLPMVSIIIPTRNGLHILRKCIESIFAKTTYKNYEILIVDNGSDEQDILDYFDQLRMKYANVRVLNDDGPFNYSALNNRAAQEARGDIIALMNNDVEVISNNWLAEMVSLALQPGVGAVGAKLLYPNNTIQHAGVILGIGGIAGHSHKYFSSDSHGYFCRLSLAQEYAAVTAACLVVGRPIFNEAGGLEQQHLTVAYNDVDFCLRLRELGYRNIWTPHAVLYHHESLSRGQEDSPEKHKRLLAEKDYMKYRWADLLVQDPAYSPNLSLIREDFSYAWPPRANFI